MTWPGLAARGDYSAVGIYDREYYRQERPSASAYVPRTIVGAIIAVNVAVWIADYFATLAMPERANWLSDLLAVHVYTLTKPWLWWEYLTAGFTHSPKNFEHILFNMLGLFFLGRDVEEAYGRKEFLRLYLVMVVLGNVVWNVVNITTGMPPDATLYGASGAVAGVVILFALNFPRRTLLLFFVLPVPAWLVGVLYVVTDMLGVFGVSGETNVAFSVHLTGAAFAFVYFRRGWNLTRLTSGHISWPTFRRKPRLRVHSPDEEPRELPRSNLSEEVDRILEKIYREGEAGLTAGERKTLETASREYQQKARRDGGSRRV